MYKKEIRLNDNEVPATVNIETGEIKEVTHRPNNIPKDKEIFFIKGLFVKSYEIAWDYLLDNLSDKELRIVNRMQLMIRMNSNSLEPLNNDTSIQELSTTFNIHRNHVKRIFKNLKLHGVYAEFEVGTKRGLKHYWVLNPYIAFKGKIINSALVDLFRETAIAELCNG